MSDLMLLGVLRMPLELHLADDVFGPPQLQSRMLQAADELERRADRIAELERENEALRKDADRYEYAKRNPTVMFERWEPIPLSPEEIDAAIDAALKEQSKC